MAQGFGIIKGVVLNRRRNVLSCKECRNDRCRGLPESSKYHLCIRFGLRNKAYYLEPDDNLNHIST